MENNISDKELYTIAVLRYKDLNPNLDDNIFPIDFNLCKDYYLKTNIIAEAIQNKVLVENTETYKRVFVKRNR